ncbi:MAG TPA: tRNA (N6-isopentenyl adenosine(37)-C2)-methylthiotransferase MiaB [Sedimentisphaerales bacterium]|nr:tRNA (N6-isopentenyl adenosine(37)-C2)-methylthiotransferase MiaB [Sedimentisphaerales bacterium]
MSGNTVHIKSFGCQMNKLDTALVNSALKEAGFRLTDKVKEADVVLINTCSVREHAEQRVISHLGHLQHIKESRPDIVVGVIGCMAQRLGPKLLEHNAVDIVCGPAQIPQITKLLTETLREKKQTIMVTDKIRQKTDEDQAQALEDFESAYGIEDRYIPGQAYVRAMRGCDNFCTYCIVPFVRGPQVSRPTKAIIEQIKKLADAGVKQVTLLGQRVNAYKYTTGDKTYCLADLLRMASNINGIEWIRFLTSYPSEEFYDEILQAMADLPKVCNYLHIPAQSGSDKILRAMNRNYTAGRYLQLLDKARAIVPDIAIAGDFMVGFPGETQADFEATIDLVKKAQYKNCFVFKYSTRPGTTADKRLEDDIPLEVKKSRNIELLAVQEKISDQLSAEFLGKQVTVLVEGLSKKPHLNDTEGGDKPQLIGRTATDYIVVFNGPPSLAGQFANVKITKTSPLTLFGRIM